MRIRLSIITITYNSSQYVRQTIESVLSQSSKDFEYIISDDCSEDNTWEIIQEYQDNRIKAHRNQTNIGEYANRNQTLRMATGDFVLWIDGDDILYRNSVGEYLEMISAFPKAKAIWGVHSLFFDFVVFPYLLMPDELTKLNFLSSYPITDIGFTDSVFDRISLIEIGGFDEKYLIGDTYIKRKFAIFYPVVLVPAGRAFWRQYSSQASQRARKRLRNLSDRVRIDEELLNLDAIPLSEKEWDIAYRNFRIRRIKLVLKNTLMKFKPLLLLKMMKRLKIPAREIFFALKKGKYEYRCNATSESPVHNNYNFNTD